MRSPLTPDARCERIAARQHGVLTRMQAQKAGMSLQSVRRRARSGRWSEVFPGVYRLPGAPVTTLMRLMAASLWSRGGAVSHVSAAFLWGLDGFEHRRGQLPLELSVTKDPGRAKGVRVHRCRSLPPDEVSEVQGIPVTSAGRTLLDLAGRVSSQRLEIALESAMRLGLADLAGLRTTLERHAASGRNGVVALRALLDDRDPHVRPTESLFESRILRLLREAGLPPPVRQLPVCDEAGSLIARPDFCYPDQRVAVEAQSWAFHAGKRAWRNDMRRLSALGARGWRVIHLTWEDLGRPRATATTIRRALAAGGGPAFDAGVEDFVGRSVRGANG